MSFSKDIKEEVLNNLSDEKELKYFLLGIKLLSKNSVINHSYFQKQSYLVEDYVFTVNDFTKKSFFTFLQGAFFSKGSISNFQKGNLHFEIRNYNYKNEKTICKLFASYSPQFKKYKRNGLTTFYLKKTEEILDILAILGASKSFLKFEKNIVESGFINSIVKANNIEILNQIKTDKAAIKQISAINLIASRYHPSLEGLFLEICELRKNNSSASLKELSQIFNSTHLKPISISGINNILRRAIEYAKEG